MSVVVERDLRRPPQGQPAASGPTVGRAVRSPGARAHAGYPGSACPGVRGRERLLSDGRRYRRRGVAGCSSGTPVHRWPATLALALVLAAGIAGLGLLAQGVAGMVSEAAPVPDETAVVVVQRGETVWELAREYAPESATPAVIDRIRQLNELTGQGVRAGTPLVVPIRPEAPSADG